jgi:hypothetical protein
MDENVRLRDLVRDMVGEDGSMQERGYYSAELRSRIDAAHKD